MVSINAALETLATLTHDEVKMLNDKEVSEAIEACKYLLQSLQTVKANRTAERDMTEGAKAIMEKRRMAADIAADLLKLKSIPEYSDLVDTGALVIHALKRGNKDAAERLKGQMYDILAKHELDNGRVMAHILNA